MRRLRRTARSVAGRDLVYRRDCHLPVIRVGGHTRSRYGAWGIVAGSIGPTSVVYSVGIGDDISFDLDLIHQTGATVHAFDPTPESLEWLETQSTPETFVVHPIALAARDGDVAFRPHENPDWISHSMLPVRHTSDEVVTVPACRLSTIMQDLGHDHIDLLKVDIEGAEYEVIEDFLASQVDVKQVLIEFHHRFPEIGLDQTRQAVAALRAAGYQLFYISSTGQELGFIRSTPVG